MGRLFDVLVDLEAYLSTFEHTYNIRSKNDLKDLKTDYEGMSDALQRLMIHVWAALASSHSNNFVEWNFTKNMKVLKGHQQLYSTLYFFGFRLNDEYKAIIDGKSDLYTAKV